MNIPNKITLFRLILVPFFLISIFTENILGKIMAIVIFVIAGLSDIFDGYIARKYGKVSNLGILLDPLVDKILISAAFISFVELKTIFVPAWMVVIIIGREFLITGIRTIAATKNRILSAEFGGKFKLVSQIIAILFILIILLVQIILKKFYSINFLSLNLSIPSHRYMYYGLVLSPYWLTFIATVFTIISGIDYFKKFKDIFKD